MSSSKSMALPVPTHDRAALLGAAAGLLDEPDDGADDDDEEAEDELAAAERAERNGEAETIDAIADGCGAGVLESARERERWPRYREDEGQVSAQPGGTAGLKEERATDGWTTGHGR